MNKKAYIILGIVAAVGFLIVGLTQGGLINIQYSEQGAYIGGGSLDLYPDLVPSTALNLDSDLSPSYAVDFALGTVFLPILGICGLITALFLVPYFILKRKNIPSRPYMALILSGLLVHYGITTLIPSVPQLSLLLSLIEKGESFMIESLFISFLIPLIVLGIAGILLYRSSVIRKLLKR